MKILLTGGSGFIGSQLADELSQSKTTFLIANRTTKLDVPNQNSVTVGDIDALTSWNSALYDISHVVHLAARVHIKTETSSDAFSEFRSVNTDGTLNLAKQAATLGVKRFIFISTIKVNGEGRNTPYLESDLPDPQDAYAVSKYEAERGLWAISKETGMEVVILRIPLVYGPGVGANFFQLLKIIDQGWPLPLRSINNKRSLLYVGNLISAILCLLQHPRAANQLFLLSDGQEASTTQLVTWLAQALGKRTRMYPVSERFLRSAAGVLGKSSAVNRLFGSLYLDSTKIYRELGWRPPFTLQEGLQATAKWYRTI
jgi:nucleoside-diphosphate-sugar epimerase